MHRKLREAHRVDVGLRVPRLSPGSKKQCARCDAEPEGRGPDPQADAHTAPVAGCVGRVIAAVAGTVGVARAAPVGPVVAAAAPASAPAATVVATTNPANATPRGHECSVHGVGLVGTMTRG